MRSLFFVVLIALICSCKTKKQNLTGVYSLKGNKKTALKLNSDSSFMFIAINRNPYLHPFDHPDETFFTTSGTWRKGNKNQIVLNSTNTAATHKPKIETKPAVKTDKSRFVFYDVLGDKVNVLSVENPDHSVSMRLHGSSTYYETFKKSALNDTIKVHLYGYNTWTFIFTDEQNLDRDIILYPNMVAGVFENTIFKIQASSLTTSKGKAKFKFRPSNTIIHD